MQQIRGDRIAIIFQEPLTSLNPLHTIEKQIGEILFVLLVLMLLFGAKKIPLIARGLGEGIRNFKKGLKSDDDKSLPEGENSSGKPE